VLYGVRLATLPDSRQWAGWGRRWPTKAWGHGPTKRPTAAPHALPQRKTGLQALDAGQQAVERLEHVFLEAIGDRTKLLASTACLIHNENERYARKKVVRRSRPHRLDHVLKGDQGHAFPQLPRHGSDDQIQRESLSVLVEDLLAPTSCLAA
jgi:hypothetical protein